MICCVFIARDEEEFSRYPTAEYGELREDCVKFIRFKVTGDYITLILSSDAKDADVRKMCMKVAAAINLVAEKSNDVVKYDEADKVCVFVHMGGEGKGGLEKLEKEIQDSLKNNAKELEKWSIFLLSSRWPNRIDVKEPEISLPQSVGEFRRLIDNCKVTQKGLIAEGFASRCTPEKYREVCLELSIIKGGAK